MLVDVGQYLETNENNPKNVVCGVREAKICRWLHSKLSANSVVCVVECWVPRKVLTLWMLPISERILTVK